MMPASSIRLIRFQQGVGVSATRDAISASDIEASMLKRRRISRSRRSSSLSAVMGLNRSISPSLGAFFLAALGVGRREKILLQMTRHQGGERFRAFLLTGTQPYRGQSGL